MTTTARRKNSLRDHKYRRNLRNHTHRQDLRREHRGTLCREVRRRRRAGICRALSIQELFRAEGPASRMRLVLNLVAEGGESHRCFLRSTYCQVRVSRHHSLLCLRMRILTMIPCLMGRIRCLRIRGRCLMSSLCPRSSSSPEDLCRRTMILISPALARSGRLCAEAFPLRVNAQRHDLLRPLMSMCRSQRR